MSKGGNQPGAGRPAGSKKETDDPKETATYRIERSLRALAREIGKGNEARGVREALRAWGKI